MVVAMESNVKQVVVEEPLDPEKGCCKPGCCCWPCVVCCSKCAQCCMPRCCKCPSCSGCPGCACIKRSLCFVPRLLCYLPRKLLSCHHLKCLLIVVVVVVLLVVIIAGALLMWLRADQRHVNAMGLWRAPSWEDDAATFYLDNENGNPAMVIYDYKNLLVSYRSWLQHACYVTRVDKDNIPGLDTIAENFQHRQAEKRLAMPLADRSLLGTTARILCSVVPVYWA
ncbi:pulmonary surfactant-associated protein C-like isoform X2 [Colius striatus]|uniref:pulmonary surfactant-associated protein C-like isoform X2 n=1 Tax=Colius striatus TaxID=57412 RepID=UPI002B1E388E|nr:pulmonary surfactant-associated protein C-like isoform X2 [Colius striatus]